MARKRRKALKLGLVADDFVAKHTSPEFPKGITLQNAWEKVASLQALEHTDNVVFSKKNKNTEICVYVDSSHWAAELGANRESLRIFMEQETGWEIDRIGFYVTRKAALRKVFTKQQKKENTNEENSLPLTEEEERYARELVSGISDKKLRDRLYKAMKADFEWKKGSKGLKLSQEPSESLETT